jgi:hypothetical protein
MELGVTTLPVLPRDATDRNRTSPFAFTGNKFEFRAVGSSAPIYWPQTVLNTAVADSLEKLADELDKLEPCDFAGLTKILSAIIKANKQVLFEGNNYSEEWHAEAAKRGLPNNRSTVDALPALTTAKAKKVFSHFGVLSERELAARVEINWERYVKVSNIEANCALDMAKTMILPAAVKYLGQLAGRRRVEGRRSTSPTVAALARPARRRDPRPRACAARGPRGGLGARRGQGVPRQGHPRPGRGSRGRPTSSRRWSRTSSGRCRSTASSSSSTKPEAHIAGRASRIPPHLTSGPEGPSGFRLGGAFLCVAGRSGPGPPATSGAFLWRPAPRPGPARSPRAGPPRPPDRRSSAAARGDAAAFSAAASSWRWVVDGGWVVIVRTAPSDAVRSAMRIASRKARPASRPPLSSKASMPPKTSSWRRRYRGRIERQAGVVDALDVVLAFQPCGQIEGRRAVPLHAQ